MEGILESLHHALLVTVCVFVVMLLIEYVNVATVGAWKNLMGQSPWRQYLFAALLGSIPGCFGTFAVAALYSHGMVTLGAVVAAMIATSGDGAFIMITMLPRETLLIFVLLFFFGISAGWIIDRVFGITSPSNVSPEPGFALHKGQEGISFSMGRFIAQWRNCIAVRAILVTVLTIFLVALLAGWVHAFEQNWLAISIAMGVGAALLMVATVPDHFLIEHLWGHVVIVHLKKIFLWSFGALLVMHLMVDFLNIEQLINDNLLLVLLVALLVSLIPDSGPQLIFITLYVSGSLPLSILIANAISQDGHGMLPVLAESRRDFIKIKGINFAFGLLAGTTGLLLGV